MVNRSFFVVAVMFASFASSCVGCSLGWGSNCRDADGGVYSGINGCLSTDGGGNTGSRISTQGFHCGQTAARYANGPATCSGASATGAQWFTVSFMDNATRCYGNANAAADQLSYLATSASEALGCANIDANGCQRTPTLDALAAYRLAVNGTQWDEPSTSCSEAQNCLRNRDGVSASCL